MVFTALLALMAAVGTFIVGLIATGNVRRRLLNDTEPTPSLPARFLDNLRMDMEDAGIDGVNPIRALTYFVVAGVVVGLIVGIVFGLTLVGIVAAILVTFVFARDRYIGNRARSLRRTTTAQVAEAGREIADSVESGMAPLDALKTFAGRASPDAASEAITGTPNRVARCLADAMARIERGMATEEALRTASEPLANRFFSSLVEAYIQTASIDATQLVASLRRVSKEVDDALLLRDERAAAIAPPKNSNRIVGGVIGAILLVLNFLLPNSGLFFQSLVGQVFIMIVAGGWYLGNLFLQSGYQEDL